ncbi:hypothetical protein [Tateyamaria sp. ANG-S1]|uniref:hypothetical protein n=1 Tax=Tateyamaria sp. ANG-S1 TaxID=1577905 RepID=UPI00057F3F21|nr:hypothetical protein [Tateyamaria sp. ANG-S1]KIC49066.1 hypothetical protein RA29_15670 [Tateyamaria sp. ANG-S1]
MALLSLIQRAFTRQGRRPLAARRPDRGEMGQTRSVPLGMEAVDMDLVDKVNRRNDALERVATIRTGGRTNSFAGRASTHVDAMPEDETYAARFHRAFQKKGK